VGKRKSGRTTHGNKTLKNTLTQCAKSAVKNKRTFFLAQYNRLVSHRGKNRATMAVAHSMAIAIYFVLSGADFKDLDSDYYNQFNREKKINSHFKQLPKLGVNIPDDALRELYSLHLLDISAFWNAFSVRFPDTCFAVPFFLFL
jgi:hypothetical protein